MKTIIAVLLLVMIGWYFIEQKQAEIQAEDMKALAESPYGSPDRLVPMMKTDDRDNQPSQNELDRRAINSLTSEMSPGYKASQENARR